MSNNQKYLETLQNINTFVSLMGLNATGAIGEIIAQVILLKAFDNVQIQNKSGEFSKPISVELFLKSLFGEANFKDLNLNDTNLLGGLVCFSHFIHKLDDFKAEDAIQFFVGRCAACQFKKCHESSDLLIPIVLKDNTITYIIIQVKNHQKFDEGKINDAFLRLKKYEKDIFNIKTYTKPILILMCLGCEVDIITNKKSRTNNFYIYGQNLIKSSGLFNEDDFNGLKSLLDCDRGDLNTKDFDELVVEQVTIGSRSKPKTS